MNILQYPLLNLSPAAARFASPKFGAVFLLSLLMALGSDASPQEDVQELQILLPEGVLPAGVEVGRPPNPASVTNAPAEAKSPEERRLQELLALKFDRS